MRVSWFLLATLVCLCVVCPAEGFTVDFTMKKSLSEAAALEFMTTILAEEDPSATVPDVYPTAIVADFSSNAFAEAIDLIINEVSDVTTTRDGSSITVDLTGLASLAVATAVIGAVYASHYIPGFSNWASITTVKVEYSSFSSALSIYQQANDDDVPGCDSATIEGIPDFIVFLLLHYYIIIIVGVLACCGVLCFILGRYWWCKKPVARGPGTVHPTDLNNNIQQPFFDSRTSQHELHSPNNSLYQNPV